MRIALISDIHGNLTALEAIVDHFRETKPDSVICLGDVAATGPQPVHVLALLRSKGWPVIIGNADAWLLHPQSSTEENDDARRILEIDTWAAGQLSDNDRAFIAEFEETIELDLSPQTLLCFHGSPHSFDDIIRADTERHVLEGLLGSPKATILAGGHTHEQLLRRYQNSLLVNPGSVGLPFEREGEQIRNPLWAEYAMLDSSGQSMAVTFYRVPVEKRALEAAVSASEMPHAQWWLDDWR